MEPTKFEKQYFGTNGIRGVIGVDMTPRLALEIAEAFGTMLGPKKTIGLGRDTRTSGPALVAAVRAGFLSCGCNVIDFDIVPTPCLQYLVLDHCLDGGIMITASHNPPEYNGIKIIEADGTEMGDERTIQLEQTMIHQKFVTTSWNNIGSVSFEPDARELYINAIVGQFSKNCGSGTTIVVDPGNGPAAATTPEILRRLGATVHVINETFDGAFPGRPPEPTAEGLASLSAKIVETNAAFGVAHDGDADRAIFVDEQGTFIDGNATFGLIASHFCRDHPGSVVVTPISTSCVVETIAARYGCTTSYTSVGSIYTARAMRNLMEAGQSVILGGEGNGGIIYPAHLFCRDGGMSAATMLNLITEKNKPLSALIAELPAFTMYQEKCKTKRTAEIIVCMKEYFEGCPTDSRDGIRITRNDAWALIRPSGTEPFIRIYTESKNSVEAKQLMDEILEKISMYLE
ncbi:MAG: phosphoglucosamine mutase [Methanocalculaceae archaeon]|jgi:phosphomannomutase/phosphoglucomutase|nr:phosphoglucosamine mutase [Methanocalculaceae archaeon]